MGLRLIAILSLLSCHYHNLSLRLGQKRRLIYIRCLLTVSSSLVSCTTVALPCHQRPTRVSTKIWYFFHAGIVDVVHGRPVQSHRNIPFSNAKHIENDECLPAHAKMVYDFIDDSEDDALKQYLARMSKMFPDRTTMSSRPMLQCPTPCVWMHTRSSSIFESTQYFALSESCCCWDLGNYFSSETVPQVAGTFLAGISGHVTTCSLWTHINKTIATLISPEPGSLMAWGSNPKKKK